MSNPARLFIARYCTTLPTYRMAFRDFVAAFKRWLTGLAPRLVREWTAPRIAQELAEFRVRVAYEDGRTVVCGIRPF